MLCCYGGIERLLSNFRQLLANVQTKSSVVSTHLQRRNLGLYSLRILLILCCGRGLLSPSQLLALESFCDFESVAQLDRGLVKLELQALLLRVGDWFGRLLRSPFGAVVALSFRHFPLL